MAKIKERVLYFIKINKLTKQDFCEKTGISYANMVGKSLNSELGGEQIYEILQRFPELNPDWLLLGMGEMLRPVRHGETMANGNSVALSGNDIANSGNVTNVSDRLLDLLSAQQKTIDAQQKTIDRLSDTIDGLFHRLAPQ